MTKNNPKFLLNYLKWGEDRNWILDNFFFCVLNFLLLFYNKIMTFTTEVLYGTEHWLTQRIKEGRRESTWINWWVYDGKRERTSIKRRMSFPKNKRKTWLSLTELLNNWKTGPLQIGGEEDISFFLSFFFVKSPHVTE